MNSRNIALDDIITILEEKKPLHTVLLASLKSIEDKRDKAFVARLVRGSVERAYSIDRIIDSVSSVKVKKQKTVIRNILRSGIYQILFMDSVTDFAACDESVKLAGKRGFRNLQGFVNGVLRNICRKKEELLKDLYITEQYIDEAVALDYRYSVPSWIADDFCRSYGKEKAKNAFAYFLKENDISIRVNTSRITLKSFEEKFLSQTDKGETGEIRLEKNRYLDKCYRISDTGSIEELPQFKDGLFVVQDMSSALVGYICEGITDIRADKKANADKFRALDLCAAPGGKSLYLADLGIKVTSCDISEQKLKLIEENATRCGFNNIEIKLNDATVFNPGFEGKFDIVLCDLPCSGLGIIGKKPDIKYNMTPEKIKELAALQKSILKIAVKYLKNGGFLLFSTCTVTGEENKENLEYLKSVPGLSCVQLESFLPEGIAVRESKDNYIQIL
ncbi:MAG: 16S rRNA (cytosine(967)-C(5))-methyltransferase RsmB, partial [Lachnospiraceae bacterium]|nr:16S rRNA (cytosine(967)-C(5))-methyltransferase RsmB [Lachnospiraceae bacterium]